MTNIWTIYNGSSYVSFSSLYCHDLRRRSFSRAQDQVTFEQLVDFDADPQWAFGAAVSIKRDGVLWFAGVMVGAYHIGLPGRESIVYDVAGAWYYLDAREYLQTWKVWEGGFLVDRHSTHLMLGQDAAAARLTVKGQIKAILDYAIAQGDPIAYSDTTFPDVEFPYQEIIDRTCAEAIRICLRYIPDAVTWWDYSTSPPTLHIARRASLTAASFTIGTPPLSAVHLRPQPEAVRPGVYLIYEQTNDVGGTSQIAYGVDKYPVGTTGLESRCLVETINLKGWTTAVASLTAAAISIDDIAWWKTKIDWLNKAEITAAAVTAAARTLNPVTYPRELTAGQLTSWMTGIVAAEDVITALITITYEDPNGNALTKTEQVSIRIQATNAPLGENTYYSLPEGGETAPTGLAESLYTSVSVLQYEGSIVLIEEDVNTALRALSITDRTGIGLVINIASGRAAWATMNAMVQDCTEDIDTGTTTLQIGPPEHLGAGDLVELLNMNRFRFIYTAPGARTSGVQSGRVTLGTKFPWENSSAGGSAYQKQVWSGASKTIVADTTQDGLQHALTDGVKEIVHDTEAIDTQLALATEGPTKPDATKKLAVRLVKYCKAGTEYYMLAVCSPLFLWDTDHYDTEEPTA